MAFELARISNDEQLNILAGVANEVWHEFFPCILSDEQIDYMVDKFQSYPAMKKQMEDGYEYYFIKDNDEICGYMGIHEETEDNKMFLSKLYLKKAHRGKGYAGQTLKELFKMSRERGLNMVWLTVNKHNEHTIEVYEHMGFAKARTQVADIGNGFVMDDYIMEKVL
ncbi:MAG: GNAT family N-acetyltransferase [Lachnospiraceae bacterium]|nr:GNAT family N-acetyltransferase [Lachnospiraceae bacterium]